MSEESEPQDDLEMMTRDVVDEVQTEERSTAGYIDMMSLEEDVAGTDEDEVEMEEHSFEESQATERERQDRDSLRIDDSDMLTCRTGN